MKHLIFYDADCPFCQFCVYKLLRLDHEALFQFAPLKGTTAVKEFGTKESSASLILLQKSSSSNQVVMRGKAVLRIFWLLGGPWTFLGLFSFLPSFFFDGIYRFIARHRFRFFKTSYAHTFAAFPDRFLP